MARVGVEPTRPHGHLSLSQARLPFHHPAGVVMVWAEGFEPPQAKASGFTGRPKLSNSGAPTWPGMELNHQPRALQARALPLELPGRATPVHEPRTGVLT